MNSITAFHSAITRGGRWEVVRSLLKQGANVNVTDCNGNTPLNFALEQRTKNLEVIKALLEYGADIKLSDPYLWGDDDAPSRVMANNLACGKLLIKYTLIQNFDRDWGKRKKTLWGGIHPYKHYLEFHHLLFFYISDCCREIHRMKRDKFNDSLSLYEFVIMNIKSASITTLLAASKIIKHIYILDNYEIYEDIILEKVKLCLKRASLLNKLSELQIYVGSDKSNQDGKEVFLNIDSTYNIGKYLSNEDLANLMKVFYKHVDKSSVSPVELSKLPDMKLDEASTSNYAKRAKLE